MAHDRKLHPSQQKLFEILREPHGEVRNKKMSDAISDLRTSPVPLTLDAKDSSDYTALSISVRQQDQKITQQLLKNGADVNVKFPWGTPLSTAAFHGNLGIAGDLVAAKADPNIQNDFEYHQQTALMETICNSNDNVAMVKLLLENGANPNIKDRFSKTALDHALSSHWNNAINYVSLLLEYKADFEEERVLSFLKREQPNPKVQYCLGVIAEKKSDIKGAIAHYEAGSSYLPAMVRANELATRPVVTPVLGEGFGLTSRAVEMDIKTNDFGTKNRSGSVYLGSFPGLWAAKRNNSTTVQTTPDTECDQKLHL